MNWVRARWDSASAATVVEVRRTRLTSTPRRGAARPTARSPSQFSATPSSSRSIGRYGSCARDRWLGAASRSRRLATASATGSAPLRDRCRRTLSDLQVRGTEPGSAAARRSDAVAPSAGRPRRPRRSSGTRRSCSRCSGCSSTVGPGLARRRPSTPPRPACASSRGPCSASDVGGGVVLAEGEQPTERHRGVAAGQVEAGRAQHGRVGLLDVDPAGRAAGGGPPRAAAGGCGTRVPPSSASSAGPHRRPTRVTSRPVDSSVARTSPARGSRVRCRAVSAVRRRLGGRAQQQVALPGSQGGEHLAGDQVGDPGAGSAQRRTKSLGWARRHWRGRRAPRRRTSRRPGDDRVADLGGVGPGVLGHQRRGLVRR